MALWLQRIIRRRGCLHRNLSGFDLKRLLRLRRQNHDTLYRQRSGHVRLADLFEIIKELFFIYHLYRLEEASVVQLDEAELIGAAVVSDPALNENLLIRILCCISEQLS